MARILENVVSAVPVPVTLKIRTGWDPANRNGVAIAQLAESIGKGLILLARLIERNPRLGSS